MGTGVNFIHGLQIDAAVAHVSYQGKPGAVGVWATKMWGTARVSGQGWVRGKSERGQSLLHHLTYD